MRGWAQAKAWKVWVQTLASPSARKVAAACSSARGMAGSSFQAVMPPASSRSLASG